MKVDRHSALFSVISQKEDTSLTGYINKFLTVHPYAGVYEVDDSEYISPQQQDRANKHFHPSGDCNKCERLLYFERVDVALIAEVFEPRTQAIFKMGSAMHAMIQAWFSAMDKLDGFPDLIGNEVRILNTELNMGGYIDSILKMPGDDVETVVEIKTINDRQFQTLTSPKSEHKLQMGCYLMERKSPKGIILYMNKNTCELKEFVVEPIDMMAVIGRWAQVRHAVANNDPSTLGYGCKPGRKEWERCPARDICFRD